MNMKKNSTLKRMFALAVMLLGTMTSFANEEQVIWVKAAAYPTGAGKVYVDWSTEDEKQFDDTSEFKRHANMAISTAYVWAEPADGYLFAGFARDNGDKVFNNVDDKQIKVNADGLFTGVYDPTVYGDGASSSSEAYALAEEALGKMESPTDYIFAVFTQGAVCRRAVGQELWGNVYADKLYTQVGDQVTFSAWGDSESTSSGTIYRKFDHWTDADGNTVSTDREFTVTVKGMDIYYAVFVETTEQEYKETEKDPHKYDSESGQLGVKGVTYSATASDTRIYDLQGRKVAAPLKGIFIRGGKKVVVK